MESGDSEYEEEEMIVLAELNGLVDDELLKKGCTYQFVGLDTDKPVLQLGKYNFLGSYEDQIGSALFLGQSADEEGRKSWSKLCFSDKKLYMQRVFLRKKGGEGELPMPPETAGDAVATEGVPESATGQEQEKDRGPEPGPSAVADEKRQEQAAGAESVSAAAAEGSSDVEMTPADDSETAPSKAQSSADKQAEESEP